VFCVTRKSSGQSLRFHRHERLASDGDTFDGRPHDALERNSFLLNDLIAFSMARIRKGTMMKDNAQVVANDLVVFSVGDDVPLVEPHAEPDPEMLEITEAKKHFDDRPDAEAYWAGRLLANRKSTRIAA
jgi:hypothetical protein